MTVSISTAPSSTLTVTLSSTSSSGTFSPTSVTIAAGLTTSNSFTYTDTTAGTWTLTASAHVATSGSTTVTVDPAAGLSTMNVGVSAGTVSKKGPNYHVPLTVTATDASGAPLGGASVAFGIYAGSTCAGTTVASGTGTTSTNGQVGFTFSTRQSSQWCALATVSSSGYSSNSGHTSFTTP